MADEGAEANFVPRVFQTELFECALKKNSILVLGTGSGKTFISIMLIKELGDTIRGPLSKGAKRTVFVAHTVPLVHQQAEAIRKHTGYDVGVFEGSTDVDEWSDEKWREEMDKYGVLVMVSEIFKNSILHKHLSFADINLIIMDECHHATGNDPMSLVMQEYRKNLIDARGQALPKILGLTACVFNGNCTEYKVESMMRQLETTMNCSLVTSEHQYLVKMHTTKPQEMIISFEEMKNSAIYEFIEEKLHILQAELNNLIDSVYRGAAKKINSRKKNVNRTVTEIKYSIKEIGECVIENAFRLEAKYLRKAEADSPEEQRLYDELASGLLRILEKAKAKGYRNAITSKMEKLLLILKEHSNSEDSRTIVFVDKRNTAKFLYSFLLKEKDRYNLQHLKPECIVGGTANTKYDLRVEQTIQDQQKILLKFRKGECNIIFSTSVLEEGIDVQKCNVVIRFDKPKSFSSYFQSLGRARAAPSKYILMASNPYIMKSDISVFRAVSNKLIELCRNRSLPRSEDIMDSVQDGVGVDPDYAPFGFHGPKIKFYSAVMLINKYCGALPQDKFTQLSVDIEMKEIVGGYQASLTLPRSAPIREPVWGKVKANKGNAKRSAALELCRRLHQIEELNNEHLMPKKTAQDFHFKNNLCIETEQVEEGKPKPGTRKRRQVYDRALCPQFKCSPTVEMCLHIIDLKHNFQNNNNEDIKLGFLCADRITCCIPMYWMGKKVYVNVQFIRTLSDDEINTLPKIKHFHSAIYRYLLDLNPSIYSFNLEPAKHFLLLVPLTLNQEIDFSLLETVSRSSSLGDHVTHSQSGINSLIENYKDTVVVPNYRPSKPFYVHEVASDMNPLSPFPENKKEFRNFKEYYRKKYNVEIEDDEQPLLRCRNFPKELNYLKKRGVHHSECPLLVPELCLLFPFSASVWWQIQMVPSIFHRINGLMLERELYKTIKYEANLQEEKNFFQACLEYKWSQFEILKTSAVNGSNLVNALNKKTHMSIHPGMILQALTPISSGDNYNLERLEVLGDSFLKYSVSVHLFCKETNNHQGKLTMERSQIVSNNYLYTLAKKTNIPQSYQGFILSRSTIVPFGFGIRENWESILREKKVSPEMWHSYTPEVTLEATRRCEMVFHPWNEQVVSDKSVADCVEALIGVYLLAGGESAARHFLTWLGFEFFKENCQPPSTAIIRNGVSEDEINVYYKKHCLDKLEMILGYQFHNKSFLIEAVTHCSDKRNKITNSYERLEFLGDAVLDYLVTGYIFAKHTNLSPGKLTDLRSYYVNNETLGRSAVKLELHKYLQHGSPKLNTCIDICNNLLDDGEQDFNREEETIKIEDIEMPKALGDLVESILGAIFIDSNQSMETCWKVLQIVLQKEFEFVVSENDIPINRMRALYESQVDFTIQTHPPTEDEPAKCTIQMDSYEDVTGHGKNIRIAKQNAAKIALGLINKRNLDSQDYDSLCDITLEAMEEKLNSAV